MELKESTMIGMCEEVFDVEEWKRRRPESVEGQG